MKILNSDRLKQIFQLVKTNFFSKADGVEVDSIGIDTTPTSGSSNLVTSGGVYSAIPSVPTQLSQLTDDSTHRTVTDSEKTTWNGKQSTLVSGANIKTINGNSVLGSGNLTVSGMPEVTIADNGKFAVVVDGEWVAEAIPQYTGGEY